MTSNPEALLARARALRFHGLLASASEQWVTKLLRRRKNEHVAVLSVGSALPVSTVSTLVLLRLELVKTLQSCRRRSDDVSRLFQGRDQRNLGETQ